ncbi:MAG: glycosyltransferase family 1 protein [Suilimivivens sp.]
MPVIISELFGIDVTIKKDGNNVQKKIKILVVNTVGINNNGITTVIYDYLKAMNRDGMTVHISSGGVSNSDVTCRFDEIGIPIYQLPHRKNQLIKYCIGFFKLCVKNKYDVIYIHGNSATMAIELIIADFLGCKVRIVHSHNSTCDAKGIDRKMRSVFYKMYTKAFACSTLAGEWLFPNREYTLIKNGRDIEKYRYRADIRRKIRKKLDISDETLAVGHVGNFCRQKNHEYLIHIFKELKEKHEYSKLFLMGYGEETERIKQLVNEMKLENDVVFMGTINNVNEVLQAMDVMCLPSLYEGLPLVAVEWQIAALPCVLSDTITRECAYTDLVEFVSLDEPYSVWADKILEADISRRGEIADDVIRATQENGFDIRKNAEELREIIIGAAQI